MADALFYREEAVLSHRKRNPSLYLPLILPLPVSLDLDDPVCLRGSSVFMTDVNTLTHSSKVTAEQVATQIVCMQSDVK